MKKLRLIIPIVCLMVFSSFALYYSVQWQISDDYSIQFSGTDAEGVFKTFTGDVQFDEADLDKSLCFLKIEVNSINTGNGMKNKHAISDKWFDAENYPIIEFHSSKFSKTETGYLVTGKIKMHGVEKEVAIPFTFKNDVFMSRFSVNRLDYHVGTMKGNSKKVSNEIKLNVSIPVTKK